MNKNEDGSKFDLWSADLKTVESQRNEIEFNEFSIVKALIKDARSPAIRKIIVKIRMETYV